MGVPIQWTVAASLVLISLVLQAVVPGTLADGQDQTHLKSAVGSVLMGDKNIRISGGTIVLAGTIKTHGGRVIQSAVGHLHIEAHAIVYPDTLPQTFGINGFTIDGHINYRCGKAGDKHLQVSRGVASFVRLNIKNQTLIGGSVAWSLTHHILTVSALKTAWNKAHIVASGEFNLLTGLGHAVVVLSNFNQEQLFALLVPKRVDIVGAGTLQAGIDFDAAGHMTGKVDLRGQKGGFLHLHQVPLLREVLAGSYGKPLADAMADDLHDYPFTHEDVHIKLSRDGMIFKLNFIRGPGNPLHLKPRVVVIGGKKMRFLPGDLKSINLTIPVQHLTIQKLLDLARKVSGS